MKYEQPLRGMELQVNEEEKDEKRLEKMNRRNLKIKKVPINSRI